MSRGVGMRKAIFCSLGSAFAAACCAGIPAVLGALSAAGLGFLVNDLILFPLLALFLGLGLWGLWDGVSRHGLQGVLVLGGIGAALLVAGIVFQSLTYVGAAAMIGAALWNVLALRQAHWGERGA